MYSNFRQWFAAPFFEGEEDKTRAATLLNTILWVFITASTLYALFAPIEPEMQIRRTIIIVPFVLGLLAVKQTVNAGYVRLAGFLVVTLLWVLFTGAMLLGADYQNPAFMGYIIVVICAGLILSWRAALGWSLFSILTNGIVLKLGQDGILPLSSSATPPFAFWVAQSVYIIASTLLISQTLRKIDESLARAQYELKERKRVEAERETIIKELESKNAELERFTYTVSHDLKSPLITIGGFIGLLDEDVRTGNAEKVSKDLTRIREAKDKMYQLLNELLELSRIGRIMNPPKNTPFADIVKEALDLTKGQLMSGNARVVVQDELPLVNGDHPRLVEVMQNLIDNAVKFTSDQPEPRIEIGTKEKDGETIFFIADNGTGIDPKFHEKIFGLFDKLDSKSEGTGVGLALVKRIIEVHGGRIWVESEGKGTGSTFLFTLPTAQ